MPLEAIEKINHIFCQLYFRYWYAPTWEARAYRNAAFAPFMTRLHSVSATTSNISAVLQAVQKISQRIIEKVRNIEKNSTFSLTGGFIRILMGKLDKMNLADASQLFFKKYQKRL